MRRRRGSEGRSRPPAIPFRGLRRPGDAVLAGALGILSGIRRTATPARATAAVTATTLLLLAASQFAEYRRVGAGSAGYGEVGGVAAPPAIASETAGDAHLWLGLPLAAAGLAVLWIAVRRRWQAARALAGIGLAGLALSGLVDAPRGLDEGELAVVYEGATAVLGPGFWVQTAAAASLLVLGPVLAASLRAQRRARPHGAGRARDGQEEAEGSVAGAGA